MFDRRAIVIKPNRKSRLGIKDFLRVKRCFSILVHRESKNRYDDFQMYLVIARDQTNVRKMAGHNGNDKVKKARREMARLVEMFVGNDRENGSQRGRNEKDGASRENFLFAPDKYFNRYSQS